ncbi:MAG: hypothetical protein HY675_06600 [Chloroflexi bacterium]|nr:hypothetical protein [Chloroflexota bacterium]
MLHRFSRIARAEFGDIVVSAQFLSRRSGLAEKLRLNLRDGTFADLWVNPRGTRYSFHWEHRARRGLIHRHDNAPDFPFVATAPKHFHNGSESQVEESHLSNDLESGLREFLTFIRTKLAELGA